MAFDHPIQLVELDERWIADVGFGDPYRVPLRLDESGDQQGLRSRYRLGRDGEANWRFWTLENEEWDFHYAFSLRPARLQDFTEACRYYETSPTSSFTQKRVCSRATPEGHLSLTDDRMITVRTGHREENALGGEEGFAAALHEHFGITVPGRFRSPLVAVSPP